MEFQAEDIFDNLFFNTEDFEVQDKSIGSGSFGAVFIGTNKKDGKKYAVKIIKPGTSFDGIEQMKFMRESLILQKLNHPGIVNFKGINFRSFVDSTLLSPSIITEYIPRGSLLKLLNEKKDSSLKFNSTKKLINLLGIAHAMKYLHQHHIVHRDLKPDNILLDDNYYPRLCDFGLSRIFPESITKSKEFIMTGEIGTPLYMAPELFDDREYYNYGVDVYAYSMVAYYIVTSKQPFDEMTHTNFYKIVNNVIKGVRPTIPEKVPKRMAELIKRCWSPLDEDRPTFEEIFEILSNDYSIIGEAVDEEEVNNYIAMLNESETNIKDKKSIDKSELERECNSLKLKIKDLEKKSNNPPIITDDFIIAIFKLLGNPKEKNPIEGISILKRSSDEGNSYSSFLLGFIYEIGINVPPNFDKSKHYYKIAANQGNSYGFYRLGCCYELEFGTSKNYKKAFNYFKKAADLGNSQAICDIGSCYYYGNGVKKELNKAVDFFQKAADLNNSKALCYLGICYLNGSGVDIDFVKAVENFKKVGDLGKADALYYLGNCYYKGHGVTKNSKKAINYYKQSKELGCKDAETVLERIKKG